MRCCHSGEGGSSIGTSIFCLSKKGAEMSGQEFSKKALAVQNLLQREVPEKKAPEGLKKSDLEKPTPVSPASSPPASSSGDRGRHYLVHIIFDGNTVGRCNSAIEKESVIARRDLLEENFFQPAGSDGGPYQLLLSLVGRCLRFTIMLEDGDSLCEHILSLSPLRRVIREYFEVCDSYYDAVKVASPSMIEAIDVGRRGLHNEGAGIIVHRLQGKIALDHNTARRLFTLICSLYVRA